MKKETITWNITSHLVTSFVSYGVLLLLGFIVFLWKIFESGEQDPLAFVAAVIIPAIFAVIGICFFACPLVVCLQALRAKIRFSTWVPVVLVFPVLYTTLLALQFSVGNAPAHLVSFGISLTLFVLFAVYWLTFALVNWTRSRMTKTS